MPGALGCWWEESDAEIRGSVFKLKRPDHLRVCGWSGCRAEFFQDSCLCVLTDDLCHCSVVMLSHLRARSRSLFSSYKPGGWIQAVKDSSDYLDSTKTCIKPWSSLTVRLVWYLLYNYCC